MKTVMNSDSCTIGSAVDDVKVSVTIRDGHGGGFRVMSNGNPVLPNPDGTVTIGKASALPGTSIVVVTDIDKVAPTVFFEADYVLQGTMCGPFTVQGQFSSTDTSAEIIETIRFS